MVGYSLFRSVSESAYLSCILSAEEGFTNALSAAESNGQVMLGEEWRTLTEAETAIVYGQFENGPKFDCSRFEYINEGKTDTGQRFAIDGRKVGQRIEVRLTNLGWVSRYQ